MEIACRLQAEAKKQGGVESLPFAAVGQAMEVIPRTLCQNCGADTIRVITKLRVWHSYPLLNNRQNITRKTMLCLV